MATDLALDFIEISVDDVDEERHAEGDDIASSSCSPPSPVHVVQCESEECGGYEAIPLVAGRVDPRSASEDLNAVIRSTSLVSAVEFTTEPKEFDVEIDRGTGGVGLDVIQRDKIGLIITNVRDGGPVADWNTLRMEELRRDVVVERGDRIVAINGLARGFPEAMRVEIKKRNKEDKLGLDVKVDGEGPYQMLLIREILRGGVIDKWNETTSPDYQIRVHDLVVKVNGKVGKHSMLMHELNQEGYIDLTIKRTSANNGGGPPLSKSPAS